jgi:hypothetical protein
LNQPDWPTVAKAFDEAAASMPDWGETKIKLPKPREEIRNPECIQCAVLKMIQTQIKDLLMKFDPHCKEHHEQIDK